MPLKFLIQTLPGHIIFLCLLVTYCYEAPALTFTEYSAETNCQNEDYRTKNQLKCKFFIGTTLPALGGATTVGGLAFLINTLAGGDSRDTKKAPDIQYASSYDDMVGADIDLGQLANITQSNNYIINQNQYNDIRSAYSLARGFTGKNTTLAVLDSGTDYWHGAAVAHIASNTIAPDTTIESYKISTNSYNFISYNEIGNVIALATNANVYNASWSVSMRATEIHSRSQFETLTDANFVNQISVAATERDAIFVWAAGNDYDTQSSALSAMPKVIPELNGHFVNVVAWDSDTGTLAEYSNQCGITKNYCITAPGSNIDTGDRIVSGTSFAAPLVSAAIAVIREAYPYMQASQITDLLFTTARDLGEPGIDEVFGHGLLDMERATRPVGVPLIPLGANQEMHRLASARISAPIAHNIKSANIKFAFFDEYGRPFTTNMKDNIRSVSYSRALEHIRTKSLENKVTLGPLEFGVTQKDFLLGEGFLKLQPNSKSRFIGFNNTFNLGPIDFFVNTYIIATNASTVPDSMISNISTIYSTSLKFSTQYQDWIFSIAIPDAILSGDITLRTPVTRRNDGSIVYANNHLGLSVRPSTEYTLKYKMIETTFVNNPYGENEFFFVIKGNLKF